ncbi:YccF domain-containing protein [Microbacterium sp. Mu-80]|uniref:YccF domain-containing protein n=1 Tax=Microbacterium bandirmense TaxID=3122050 RepID=A0ABU8LFB6_9MICO
MRTILNIIWVIFAGWSMFLGYVVAGILLCIPIVTIPWAIASFRLANYAFWPFGRDVVDRSTSGIGSMLGNIIWVVLAGWWLAIGHIVTGVAMCLTIIGIPMGIAAFKMVPISLMPLGKEIVPAAR